MRNIVLLMIVIGLLYLVPSVILEGVYGPSYGFLAGEDHWMPDGDGGWMKHGNPTAPQPTQPSENIPVLVRYVPIFLPALLLVLFIFTPLSKKLEGRPAVEASTAKSPSADGDISSGR